VRDLLKQTEDGIDIKQWEEREQRAYRSGRLLRKAFAIVAYSILIAWGILAIFPLFFMVTSAFKELGPAFTLSDMEIIPKNPTIQNFRKLFQYDLPEWAVGSRRPIFRWIFNGFLVAIIPTMSNLFFGAMAGYAISKMRFPGRVPLFWAIVATMMIPGFVPLVPLYKMMFDFHWFNTYWALLVPGMAGVSGIFLMKQNIQTLPSSLIDAARIDGCGEFRIFWKVIFPLCKPILAVLGIFGFVSGWNNWFWPFLVTESRSMETLQVGLVNLAPPRDMPVDVDYGVVMAGVLLAAIPTILVFFAFQKYLIRGITIGAMKG